MRWFLPLAATLVLAGCASNLPKPIRQAPEPDLALSQVLEAPERYVGRRVRWGGTIAGIDNRSEQTCLEVVARELQSSGRPLVQDRSAGRFLACTEQFLDPMIYSEGRLVTAAGTVGGAETRPVGQFPYRYPVVRAEHLHLWQPEPEPRYYEPDPFWYDPFWPWPYYRYPWYGPPGWYGYPRYW